VRVRLYAALQRLDGRLQRRLADRTSLAPPERRLRDNIVADHWRGVVAGFLGGWALVLLDRWIDLPLLLSAPIWLTAILLFGARVERQAHETVRSYLRDRDRHAYLSLRRMQAPYERMAPVATAFCSQCNTQPGQRHARICPTIPAGWFNHRGDREQR